MDWTGLRGEGDYVGWTGQDWGEDDYVGWNGLREDDNVGWTEKDWGKDDYVGWTGQDWGESGRGLYKCTDLVSPGRTKENHENSSGQIMPRPKLEPQTHRIQVPYLPTFCRLQWNASRWGCEPLQKVTSCSLGNESVTSCL